MSLTDLLPAPGTPADPDVLLDAFTTWASEQGITLYPAQEEALIEILTGANVILSTPTGSGKSLVATGAHFAALAEGRRTYYTAPIKALVSEKFFALCDVFGADKVGMMTGDASVNAHAPIICCTAEVLANQALREGAAADVGQVVMDEFHFYSEPDRGWAWQVPLLELPQAQFLLMSATLGDVTRFQEDLTRRTGRETAVVTNTERPVPLSYSWALTPLHETLEELRGFDAIYFGAVGGAPGEIPGGIVERGIVTYDGTRWTLPLDATVEAGGLTISLDGLSVRSPLGAFNPQFGLQDGAAGAANTREVPVTTLLALCQSRDINRIRAMKIDVEGHEPRILGHFFDNAPETLWPEALLIEHVHDDNGLMQRLIDSLGYVERGRTARNLLLSRASATTD